MADEISFALATLRGGGVVATELTCPSEGLRLRVDGVGPVSLPITAAAAKALLSAAEPAPYGRGSETLFDRRVRDTGQIAAKRVHIEQRAWKPVLSAQLEVIRERLGLPEGGRLEAQLDKLLVYGPGQFFAMHQDTERDDDMVASLVVVLPSRHRGGSLVVEHRGEKQMLLGQAKGQGELAVLAFYADCQHEVTPVESGTRVALTYHLFFRAREGEAAAPSSPAPKLLLDAIRNHFATPVAPRYGGAPAAPPDRLIYLLDHEYSSSSLGWQRLKGADRVRAGALVDAAAKLDCEVFLALADVHESWICEDDYDDYRRRRYRDDDEEDAQGEGEPTLLELNDTEIELRHWVDREGRATEAIGSAPTDAELCATRESIDLPPFRSEHEGYMGNYGNTADRWYHRAAVVMWPRARDFVVRAQVSPGWAVGQIARKLKARARDEARSMAKQLMPFWDRVAGRASSRTLGAKLLEVAFELDDAPLALDLLSPVSPEQPSHESMPYLVALVERHGASWGQKLFESWFERGHHRGERWLTALPAMWNELSTGGPASKQLSRWQLEREAARLKNKHLAELKLPRSYEGDRRKELLARIARVLEASASTGAREVSESLVALLADQRRGLPIEAAGDLLERCASSLTPAASTALEPLFSRVLASVEASAAGAERSADDWSIATAIRCSCDLCKELSSFLRSAERVEFPWPLAKERRAHVHQTIDSYGLPVSHVTHRQGSPYTLVLKKLPSLFKQDAARRAREAKLLSWLNEHRAAFVGEAPGQAEPRKPAAARGRAGSLRTTAQAPPTPASRPGERPRRTDRARPGGTPTGLRPPGSGRRRSR